MIPESGATIVEASPWHALAHKVLAGYEVGPAEAEAILRVSDDEVLSVLSAAFQLRKKYFGKTVQLYFLVNAKSGLCPEDCGYCSQSVKADSGVEATKLMDVREVLQRAAQARDAGSQRFCMGAAWRNPKDRDMPWIVEIVKGVREMGMETCMTLGMLTPSQAGQLHEAGLDYYNHNVDTSEQFYEEIITTRTYKDRLDTLDHVRGSGMNVCSGGIVGMGEAREDRAGMLMTLANLPDHPESVPINMLVQVDGTPLAGNQELDILEFIRTIAVARIMMPKSIVRLSAGREWMSDETQALCFLAGANSIFVGDELLTTKNPGQDKDQALFDKLGLEPMPAHRCPSEV